MDTRFHCVYLLTSLDPHFDNYYYVGYTVNPLRRIRQHNGEIQNGAWKTSRRGRPWTMVLCVSGFTEDRIALRFEWSWQHPYKVSRLKGETEKLRGLTRLNQAVGTLHLLLKTEPFSTMSLTLHLINKEKYEQALPFSIRRKIDVARESTPLLKIMVMNSMEDLGKLLTNMGEDEWNDDEEELKLEIEMRRKEEQGLIACTLCRLPVSSLSGLLCTRPRSACCMICHLSCLAQYFFSRAKDEGKKPEIIPTNAVSCPLCDVELHWSVLVQQLKQRINKQKKSNSGGRRRTTPTVAPTKKHRDDMEQSERKRKRIEEAPPVVQQEHKKVESATSQIEPEDEEEWLNF